MGSGSIRFCAFVVSFLFGWIAWQLFSDPFSIPAKPKSQEPDLRSLNVEVVHFTGATITIFDTNQYLISDWLIPKSKVATLQNQKTEKVSEIPAILGRNPNFNLLKGEIYFHVAIKFEGTSTNWEKEKKEHEVEKVVNLLKQNGVKTIDRVDYRSLHNLLNPPNEINCGV